MLAPTTIAIAAAALAAVIAALGFDRPSWARSHATALRYRLARAAYAAAAAIFGLALYFIVLGADAWFAPAAAVENESAWLASAGAALVAILAANFLPQVGGSLREWLHERAGVPASARRFAAALAETGFAPRPEIADEAREILLARGIDVGEETLPIARQTIRSLLKLTMLYVALRRAEAKPRFRRFLSEARNDFDVFRRRFDRLSFRVSRALTGIERLGEVSLMFEKSGTATDDASERFDALLRRMVGDAVTDASEDIGLVQDDACLLVARAALALEPTRAGRDRFARQLGFDLKTRPRRSTAMVLGRTLMVLYAGMWVFFVAFGQLKRTIDLSLPELISVVTLVVFGSMAVSIVPKLRWGFANAGLHARTPPAFVVGAGVCGLLYALLVQLAAGALLNGGWSGALLRLSFAWPFLPSAFVTAASTAWVIQDHRWRDARDERARRIRDALFLGAAWFLSSCVSLPLLRLAVPEMSLPLPVLLAQLSGAFLFGAVIGWMIPETVRVDRCSSVQHEPTTPLTRFDISRLGIRRATG